MRVAFRKVIPLIITPEETETAKESTDNPIDSKIKVISSIRRKVKRKDTNVSQNTYI